MRVIGTAGHVDHGKSTLVQRLTGIDPDRLAEEKARQMTIDLGFAWLKLPTGETVGIVDVPGHRDFIENMLAGVGGIDAVLLVIAADEGVMPQTREHLAILDLLGIQHGLVVLSKTDMVDDPDWLELVERDIADTLMGTALQGAAIVPVSARTGAGIAELNAHIAGLMAQMPPRADYGQPRLPIDRVFTISGFGTVVTGTLLGGALRLGDEVVIEPAGLRGRVRGLQSYKQTVSVAEPGSRVAVNVSGVERSAVARGFVLTHPGRLLPTTLVDVHFRYLADASRPLKHNAEVKFFAGAAETMGYVRLLDSEMLQPGADGWLQIRLEKPLALAQGDRFIVRCPSPSETVGGGLVVNPQPGRRWRRFQPDVIEALATRLSGTPAQRLAQAVRQPEKRATLTQQLGFSILEMESAVQDALAQGLIVELPSGELLDAAVWRALLRHVEDIVRAYHVANPLRLGMPREEVRSRMGLRSAVFNALLEMQTVVVAAGDTLLRAADHCIQFDDRQAAAIATLRDKLAETPYTPPSFAEAAALVGEDVLYALIDLNEIVQIQPDVILAQPIYVEMVDAVLEIIDARGSITAAQMRDRFNTTRKYAIGLLEHLDTIGVTRRVGDSRVRGHRSR